MKLRAEMLAVGRGRDKVVVDLGRFDAREPHPPVAWDAVEPTKQMPEPKRRPTRSAAGRFDAVVADMDAAKHDLTISVANQPPHFVFDVVGRAARQSGPHVRNDAIGAFEDAAVLHLDIRSLSAVEVADAARHID